MHPTAEPTTDLDRWADRVPCPACDRRYCRGCGLRWHPDFLFRGSCPTCCRLGPDPRRADR